MSLTTNSCYQNTCTNSASYALKFIDPYKPITEWNPQDESSVLSALLTMPEHRNILKYFGKFHVHLGGAALWSVVCTEVCRGSLQDFLHDPIFANLTEPERIAGCWEIVRQVLTGLQRCHCNGQILMHRDIKVQNST